MANKDSCMMTQGYERRLIEKMMAVTTLTVAFACSSGTSRACVCQWLRKAKLLRHLLQSLAQTEIAPPKQRGGYVHHTRKPHL